MSQLLEWIIAAAVAVIVPGILAALWGGIKYLSGIKVTVDAMKAGGEKRSEETRTIVKAILTLSDTQRVTLEAIRDGKCNGNITSGLARLDENDKQVEAMLIERVG